MISKGWRQPVLHDQASVAFTVLRDMGQVRWKVGALSFKGADFQLYSQWHSLGDCLQGHGRGTELADV